MNDFKGIADEIMDDIRVTAPLKAKTLARCKKRSGMQVVKYLVPAACLLLIFSVARMTGLFTNNNPIIKDNNTEISILMASPGAPESTREIIFNTLDEARKAFGDGFLAPSKIPEGFTLDNIRTLQSGVSSVALHYSSQDRDFTIFEQKAEVQNSLSGFRSISINEAAGYIKSDTSDINNKKVANTELYWFSNGVQYHIAGSLTESEAVETANSMN